MSDDPFAICAGEVRRRDPDVFLCALAAPAALRNHLLALACFHRELADIRLRARTPILGAMRLQWWWEAVGQCLDDHATLSRPHPVLLALAITVRTHDLPRDVVMRMITVRQEDHIPYPDGADATCGALNQLWLRVLGLMPDDAQNGASVAHRAAQALGRVRYLLDTLRRDAQFLGDFPGGWDGALAAAETALRDARAQSAPAAALPVCLAARLLGDDLKRLRKMTRAASARPGAAIPYPARRPLWSALSVAWGGVTGRW